ncbi:hypothetical protein SALBM311S_02590 [Streptomyces alboniger]
MSQRSHGGIVPRDLWRRGMQGLELDRCGSLCVMVRRRARGGVGSRVRTRPFCRCRAREEPRPSCLPAWPPVPGPGPIRRPVTRSGVREACRSRPSPIRGRGRQRAQISRPGATFAWRHAFVISSLSSRTAGLPGRVRSPRAFVGRRLVDKMPPELPAPEERRSRRASLIMECTECRVPGRPEALPGGLCRACRGGTTAEAQRALPPTAVHVRAAQVRGAMRMPLRA